MSKMSAQKRQLEKNRQERAAAKRERRQARPQEGDTVDDGVAQNAGPEVDQDVLLAQFAELHRQFADGAMSLEEFEEQRDALAQRLRLD